MNVGLLGARADRRGLSAQTRAFARHMDPARILGIVDPMSPKPDWEGWPKLWGTLEGRQVDQRHLVAFCQGLDVVWGAETFYSDQFCNVARKTGTRTVLHANPEFFRFDVRNLPRPDLVLNPTSWLHDRLEPATVLPFPVDRRRFRYAARPLGGPVRFLHVVGHPAMHDRAGTHILLKALTVVRRPIDITIRTQKDLGRLPRPASHVRLHMLTGDLPSNDRLYDGFDVLVTPRRYGGQHLPYNEASSAGLAIVATDCPPQTAWLHDAGRIKVRRRRSFRGQAGPVPMCEAEPRHLAAILDQLADDPDLVADMSAHSDRHADSISWATLKPSFVEALG